MKTVKISLALVVVGLITFLVVNSIIPEEKPASPPPPKNQFTESIEQEIIDLQKLPANRFYKEAYNDVIFHIDDFYKKNRLGKNKIENNKWRELLSKNLYSVYTDKFIKQTFNVFNKSEWNNEDLIFIRSESAVLRKSKFLKKDSPIDNSFVKIQQILGKYDEINSFIASCKGFSYSDESFDSAFPLSEVKKKMARALSYKKNNLENSFVNNCVSLHNQLNEINNFLFYSHINYLDKKINDWSGMFTVYNSHGEYAREFYFKLKSEINILDNDIYKVSDFDSKYDKLIYKLNLDNSNAKAFFAK